ncbi:hypothetical protein ACNOYE_27270 [Nannocystaceae bacterium ST9]
MDFDHDGAAEFVVIGATGELVVASAATGGEVESTTHVEVGWGGLSRCSSDDLVFYRASERWWLWRFADARLDAVAQGQSSASFGCFDLGDGADTVVEIDDDSLRVGSISIDLELLPLEDPASSFVVRPEDDSGERFSLFTIGLSERVYVASIDLAAPEVSAKATWVWGPTIIHALAVVGRDLVVAGPVSLDAGELAIVRDVDPSASDTWQPERIPLPWWPRQLLVAQLDDDEEPELVVAPLPISAIALVGVGAPQTVQMLDLDFEGVDLATGDVDGDGKHEIFAIDPREERIVEIAM